MSHELCSLQSSGAQRAPTRSQLKLGLPSRLLTALCARHIHWEKLGPLLTSGGSRLCVVEGAAWGSRGSITVGDIICQRQKNMLHGAFSCSAVTFSQ
jgi:hypothetical protein